MKRALTSAVLALTLVAGVGCGQRADSKAQSGSVTKATTARPGTRANPLIQPLNAGEWANVTASPPEILNGHRDIPAIWNDLAEPGQTWAKIQVSGTFTDAQATNGDPASLESLFSIEGSKGKTYEHEPLEYGPAFAQDVRAEQNLLSAKDKVLAGQSVTGHVFFRPDANDTGPGLVLVTPEGKRYVAPR